MSNEQFEEKQNRGPLDTIESVGLAALAVGAGAALFYRGRGAEVLSNGVRKANKFISEVASDVSTMALKDFDLEGSKAFVNKHITGENSTWKGLASDFDNIVRLDPDSNQTAIKSFVTSFNAKENPNAILGKLYVDEDLKPRIQNVLKDEYAKDNLHDQHFFNKLVDDIIKNPSNAYKEESKEKWNPKITYQQDKFKGTRYSEDDQRKIMDIISDHLIKEKTNGNKDEFIRNNKAITDALAQHAASIEGLEKKFGSNKKTSFWDTVLGGQRAVINDLLDEKNRKNVRGYNINIAHEDGSVGKKDVLDILAEMVKQNPEYGNLHFDHTTRMVNGKLHSFKETADSVNHLADGFANTIFGKLGKVRDILQIRNAPMYAYFGRGQTNPILARTEGDINNIASSYFRILDKTYKVNVGSSSPLEHVSALDNTYLTSGHHGAIQGLIKKMSGTADRGVGPSNPILKFLDLFGQPEMDKFTSIKSKATKFTDERWERNILKFLKENSATSVIHTEQGLEEYFNKIKSLDKMFRDTSHELNMRTINKLSEHSNQGAREFFEFLKGSDEELLEYLNKKGSKGLLNPELASLITRYNKNSGKTKDIMHIISDGDGTRTIGFHEMLRKEVAKEAFLVESEHLGGRLNSITSLIHGAGVVGADKEEALHLANWAIMQHYGKEVPSSIAPRNVESMLSDAYNVSQLFHGEVMEGKFSNDKTFIDQFRETTTRKVNDYAPLLANGFRNEGSVVQGQQYGEWMFMRKAITPKDILRNMNAETFKAAGKQLYAGRGNMNDVTTATLFPYFGVMRLFDPLAELGLSLSPKNTGSVGDLAYSMFTKRILPIAGGLAALNYVNDTMKQITGTSLTGLAANSIGNMDLMHRRIVDAMGMTQKAKTHRLSNPMAQYLLGDEYQDADERKAWYENGYSPVRKGRFWAFGSSSEFRGGKIAYWEPNYVKRANSDWHDIGVYGSTSEKWAHSWIPTPQHPLAPLRRLLDPYWLEKKHYWDRPYPVTGKMFEEGTPWGGILNPTIGAMLKPQHRMHGSELGGSMLDVRALIAERNARIRAKADPGLVKITNTGAINPTSFSPISNPTPGEAVLNLKVGKHGVESAQFRGSDYSEGVPNIRDFSHVYNILKERSGNALNPGIALGGNGGTDLKSIGGFFSNIGDRIRVSQDTGGFMGGMVRGLMPSVKDIIGNHNLTTMQNAAAKKEDGVSLDDSFLSVRFKNRTGHIDEDTMQDLRSTTSTKEALHDALYSSKDLAGIYGFLTETALPKSRGAKLASADKMSSFSRSFWDQNLGGFGGEFMEIARRFFPHEDHDIKSINTIRNLMPEWMPDRFKYGDPYTALPKGEMRLPGKGYESLQKLHPDAYGKYGAFDRFKILADIAPTSHEYKIWRGIATKTTTDSALKQEIKDVKKRVNAQLTDHEFYAYKFNKDNALKSTTGVIEQVNRSGFKILGDDTVYRMAGIKMNKEGGPLNQYLEAGMKVRLRYGKNPYYQKSTDGSISAIVIAEGQNLNKKLLEEGKADEREDTSPAGIMFRFSDSDIARGKVFEKIAHAQIPYIHNKFMKVNTALESYKEEQIYGTSYATWNHPLQGFVIPAMQKSVEKGPAFQALGLAAMIFAHNVSKSDANSSVKKMAQMTAALSNGNIFAGGMIGYMSKLKSSNLMVTGGYVGAAAGLAAYAYTRSDKPISSTLNFGVLGAALGHQFIHDPGKGAAIGAAAGLAISALRNPNFDKNRMFGAWIPKRVQKRWEVEEYFDRLEYIKYMGLYNKAAKKARLHEHVNIKGIVNLYEQDMKRREKIQEALLANRKNISNRYAEGDPRAKELTDKIDSKLQLLKYPTQDFKAGKYARAALAYKQAAESTIYGLKEDATWVQLARAVPRKYRDYILEFVKEKDPTKRKEILRTISPYQRKVLQIAWGDKPTKLENNLKFFSKHQLPGVFWSGWQPDVNLDNVEAKLIKNEGMLLSDFGFYESQTETQQYREAPTLDMHQETGSINLRKNLISSLNGSGLVGVDVSVEPSSKPGIQMVANVARITNYNAKQSFNNFFGRILY